MTRPKVAKVIIIDMSRGISILGLLQAMLIVAGFFIVRNVLWAGYALMANERRAGGFYPVLAWVMGYSLLALLFFLFLYVAVFPFTRKILLAPV